MNRWGILRRQLAANMGLRKSTSLVICLLKLHNFCIDERLASSKNRDTPRGTVVTEDIAPALGADNLEIICNGGFSADEETMTLGISASQGIAEIVGGGHHHDDNSPLVRQQFARRGSSAGVPRDRLHDIVVSKGLKRPTPRHWTTMA